MFQANTERLENWAKTFQEYWERLLALAKRNLNPVLARRISAEDVVQDTLSSACAKIEFFEKEPDIPVYFKLRRILFQTIAAQERRHLQSQKRDAYKEADMADGGKGDDAKLKWEMFADSMTGPLTKVVQKDRYRLLRKAIAELPDNDRRIIELRHFDGLSNADCAEILGLGPKAASIRYVRALQRLQKQLIEFTEFQS